MYNVCRFKFVVNKLNQQFVSSEYFRKKDNLLKIITVLNFIDFSICI